jgi:hypothetical protein
MDNEEKKCNCHYHGNNDRVRLKEFNSLELTIHTVDNTEQEQITLVVSGNRCNVCNRIELSTKSKLEVINTLRHSDLPESGIAMEKRLKNVIVRDAVNNRTYNAFRLYVAGNSDLILK